MFLFYILIRAQPSIDSMDSPFSIIFLQYFLSTGSSTTKEVATTKIQQVKKRYILPVSFFFFFFFFFQNNTIQHVIVCVIDYGIEIEIEIGFQRRWWW